MLDDYSFSKECFLSNADLICFSQKSYINIVMLLFLLLLFLTTTSNAQIMTESMMEEIGKSDPNLLRILNNYFGCKVWVDGECTQCADHYYFNDKQICCEVTPQCKKFNRGVGICQECYFGYEIYDGSCMLKDVTASLDRGCKKFINGECSECSARWFHAESGYCEPVSDLCRKWDTNTGLCTGCYLSYNLQGGQCLPDTLGDLAAIDIFCSEWSGRSCLQCAERAYFGPEGICLPVSDYCRTWDSYDGFCLTCYRGYKLLKGQCVETPENNLLPSDIGCRIWDWQNQICLECSVRWVFDKTGTCMPVSDDCKFYNEDGLCSECYKGYDLQKGVCIFSPKNLEAPSDIGCRIWNWDDKKCLECSERWTFNDDDICIPVSEDCKEYDNFTGGCTDCYKGYDLIGNKCIISEKNSIEPTDPGCKIWDWQQQICLQCSFRWFFNTDGKCKKAPDVCKQFQFQNCTSCYPGYELQDGNCEIILEDYCEIRENNVCLECYPGYKLNEKKQCELGNPLCRDADSTGKCTSCFTTFVLYKDICVPLVKLVNLAEYYATCCPDKLEELKRLGRIV